MTLVRVENMQVRDIAMVAVLLTASVATWGIDALLARASEMFRRGDSLP